MDSKQVAAEPTPGPWVQIPGTSRVIAGTIKPFGYEGFHVADAKQGRGGAREGRANARLIAAAPALAEALRLILGLAVNCKGELADAVAREARAALVAHLEPREGREVGHHE